MIAIGTRGSKKIHVIQGEYQVVDDPEVVLSTVLGSCVAACLRDPQAGVGGMNHFLLPGEMEGFRSGDAERVGVHLMELLVNGLLKRGARRENLEAKLFGGARMMEGLSDIGAKNATFAKRFLTNEGIKIIAEAVGGTRGRRIEFHPVSGHARQIMLSSGAELAAAPKAVKRPLVSGNVELF